MEVNFEENINEIEKLYCDQNANNLEIIRSHSLEILLSYSTTPSFVKIMETKADFIKEILNTLNTNIETDHKVLLFFVNITNSNEICKILSNHNCVERIVSLIFSLMKNFTNENLLVKKKMFD